MPKATPTAPLSCLFAINKPTGHVSMQLLNRLQPLFNSSALFTKPAAPQVDGPGARKRKWREERVKMGQGGTLDPLADGVLVIGTNNATKHLAKFLDCTKEYRAIGYLGCATDTYDSEGKRVTECAWEGITRDKIEAVLHKFRGDIEQVPPIFSAIKMDGKPLYEYARTGTPLPRPIAARKCNVSQLSLLNFTDGALHTYDYPKELLEGDEKAALLALEDMIKTGGVAVPNTVVKKVHSDHKYAPPAPTVPTEGVAGEPVVRAPTFEISMTVSSGTYVRSIVHDIGIALGSAAYVVKLTRTRQGEFTLNDLTPFVPAPLEGSVPTPVEPSVPTPTEPSAAVPATEVEAPPVVAASTVVERIVPGGCIEWEVIEAALAEHAAIKAGTSTTIKIPGDLAEWEQQLLAKCQLI